MKNLIKSLAYQLVKLLINILKRFNAGRYIIEQLSLNVSKIIIEIPEKNINLKFYSPNRLNNFRIKTFFSKEPETINWINNFKKP